MGIYGFSRDNNQLIFGSDEKSEFSEAFAYNINEEGRTTLQQSRLGHYVHWL